MLGLKAITQAQVAINWCLCKGTIPIPGAKSIQQVEEALGALNWRLSSSEITALDAAADKAAAGHVAEYFSD